VEKYMQIDSKTYDGKGTIRFLVCFALISLALIGLVALPLGIDNDSDGGSEQKAGGVTYSLDMTTGVLTITKGQDDNGIMLDYNTTGSAPWSKNKVKTVTIGEGVIHIGDYAFYNQSNLTSVTLPATIESIGESAFQNVTALTEITLLGTDMTIGSKAFQGCTNLANITMATNSVADIGDSAFRSCSSIVNLSLPSGLTSIGDQAFAGCSKLQGAALPYSLLWLGADAYSDCTSLRSVYMSDMITYISDNTFYGCSSLVDLTLPAYLESIGVNAFKGCTSLLTLTIPSSIYKIETTAFSGCTSLSKVTIPANVTTMGSHAFEGLKFIEGAAEVEQTVENLSGKVWEGSGTDAKLYCLATGQYTVTFNSNGGTATSTQMFTVGSKLPSLPAVTKGASHFDGWFDKPEGGSRVTTSTIFNTSTTLYAYWDVIVDVTGVTLDKTELSLVIDEEATLEATVVPSNATYKTVTWSSSSPDIVSVDSNGKIKGLKAGQAEITVTTTDGGKTAKCAVTVSAINVESITIEPTEKILKVSPQPFLIRYQISPADATDKTLTWVSSNTDVAVVDAIGVVTLKAAGNATITVTTNDGGKTATCDLTVVNDFVDTVTLDREEASIQLNETLQLIATVLPAEATQSVTWFSSDTTVATVDENGKVTPVSEGLATIRVTTDEGSKTAACAVVVTKVPVTQITLDRSELELGVGGTYTLTATVLPSDATDKRYDWSSSDLTVAMVDENGNVIAIAPGTAEIKATSKLYADVYGSCTVTVAATPVSSVTIGKSSLQMELLDLETLTVTVLPADATFKGVVWSTSDAKVATVDENGRVTAVGKGIATITVKAATDGTKTDSCTVTVGSYKYVDGKVSIEGDKAVVTNASQLKEAIDRSVATGVTPIITISAGTAGTVVIPSAVVQSLGSSSGMMTLVYNSGTIAIPAAAASKIDVTASTVGISLKTIGVPESYASLKPSLVFSLNVLSGDTVKETQFGSNVTVVLPYTLKDGEKAQEIRLVYLPATGKAVEMDKPAYADGFITFEIDHFSDYAIMFHGIPEDSSLLMYIVIAIIIIVIVAILLIYLLRVRGSGSRRSKRGSRGKRNNETRRTESSYSGNVYGTSRMNRDSSNEGFDNSASENKLKKLK
jgi:uncharacterized protein YjdB